MSTIIEFTNLQIQVDDDFSSQASSLIGKKWMAMIKGLTFEIINNEGDEKYRAIASADGLIMQPDPTYEKQDVIVQSHPVIDGLVEREARRLLAELTNRFAKEINSYNNSLEKMSLGIMKEFAVTIPHEIVTQLVRFKNDPNAEIGDLDRIIYAVAEKRVVDRLDNILKQPG